MSPTRRMGGMNKLSDFGRSQEVVTFTAEEPALIETGKKLPVKVIKNTAEKSVSVNIKVPASQQKWLADTAQQVRGNNDSAVAAADRVFPQHLIQVAIDLLRDQGIDWTEVKNVAELRDSLNI